MGNGDYITLFKGMNLPSFWRVHLQRLMDAIVIVVLKVRSENPFQVPFVENDDAVEALPADRSDQTFTIRILPW